MTGMTQSGVGADLLNGADLFYNTTVGFYCDEAAPSTSLFDWETTLAFESNGWNMPTDPTYELPSLGLPNEAVPQNPLWNLELITITFDYGDASKTNVILTMETGGTLADAAIPEGIWVDRNNNALDVLAVQYADTTYTVFKEDVSLTWAENPVYDGTEQTMWAEVSGYTGDTVPTISYDGMTVATDVGASDYGVTAAISNPSYVITSENEVHTWNIIPRPYSADEISIADIGTSHYYTGSAIEPIPTIQYGEMTLRVGTDYTLFYGENTTVDEGGWVQIVFQGNFSGDVTIPFVIRTADGIAGQDVFVTIPSAEDWVDSNGQMFTVADGYTVATTILGSYGGSVTLNTQSQTTDGTTEVVYVKAATTGIVYPVAVTYYCDHTIRYCQ